MLSTRSRTIVWCGPSSGSLGWLKNQLEKYCSEQKAKCFFQVLQSSYDFGLIAEVAEQQGMQRLVIACENRWDYPSEELREFTSEFPDVPTALAMSDWWLGSRRTGIGHLNTLPHLSLPWFRWWDGWHPWLGEASPAMFGPYPRASANQYCLFGGCSKVDPAPAAVLVTGCPANAQTLRHVLGDHWNLKIITGEIEKFQHAPPFTDATCPRWILWDDSRLNTSPGIKRNWFSNPGIRSPNIATAIAELSTIQSQYPSTRLWVVWTQPGWNEIRQLIEAGIDFQLLANP